MATIGKYSILASLTPSVIRARLYEHHGRDLWWAVEITIGAIRLSLDHYRTREHAIAMARAHLEATHRERRTQGIAVSPIIWSAEA